MLTKILPSGKIWRPPFSNSKKICSQLQHEWDELQTAQMQAEPPGGKPHLTEGWILLVKAWILLHGELHSSGEILEDEDHQQANSSTWGKILHYYKKKSWNIITSLHFSSFPSATDGTDNIENHSVNSVLKLFHEETLLLLSNTTLNSILQMIKEKIDNFFSLYMEVIWQPPIKIL